MEGIRIVAGKPWSKTLLDKAFNEFRVNIIDEEIRREMTLICQNIIFSAIRNRMKTPGAHDFTGNLLNSIVAVLYKDRELIYYYTSAGSLRQPRYYEMRASHGHYHFKVDYRGQKSDYTPEVETFERKGIDDAMEFMSIYTPNRDGFVMVLAYTTDYADFVEMERSTTGYLRTYAEAEKMFRGKKMKFLGMTKSA